MERFFEMQRMLMGFLGVPTEKVEIDSRLMRTVVLGLASEVGEVAQEINTDTRPWADGDEEDLKEEMVDIFFYLLEGFIIRGMSSDDVYKIYRKKFAKNVARVVAKAPGIAEAIAAYDEDENIDHIPQQIRRAFLAGKFADQIAFDAKLQAMLEV